MNEQCPKCRQYTPLLRSHICPPEWQYKIPAWDDEIQTIFAHFPDEAAELAADYAYSNSGEYPKGGEIIEIHILVKDQWVIYEVMAEYDLRYYTHKKKSLDSEKVNV